MTIKFSGFEEYFTDFHPHTLFYGTNGTGKTTFAGKSGMRTVLLDCGDAGVVTLRGTKTVKIIRVQSTSHYFDVIEEVHRITDKFDLLVVDTLTGLQSMSVKEVKGKRGEMSQRKWGQAASRVIECISETRTFKKDIIYLAQEKRRNKAEGDDTVQYISPSLMPSVREFLSGSVDWVGRFYLDGDQRKLSFILSGEVEAKDRAGLFPKPLNIPGPDKPSYVPIRKRIVEAIHG